VETIAFGRPSDLSEAHSKLGIVVFLLIAFGLAWIPFVPSLFGREPVGLILMPVAPAIAAIVVRRWVTREGFRDSGLRPNLRRWRYYLIAVTWPLAATLASVPVAIAMGLAPAGVTFPWGLDAPGPRELLTWLALSIVPAPLIAGEEIGWRGYLQVRLFAGKPMKGAVATGLIWGVWHYPMILTGGQEIDGRLQLLLIFPLATTTLSVFLGWLRLRTGDIWAGSVAHAANNVTEDSWTRLAFTGQTAGVPAWTVGIPILLAEAVVLLGIVALDRCRHRGRRPARSAPARTQRPAASPG
jgi:uncharacterized protein